MYTAYISTNVRMVHSRRMTEWQWSPRRHRYAPRAFQHAVVVLKAIQTLEPNSVLYALPNELVFEIIAKLPLDSFDGIEEQSDRARICASS